MHFFLDHDWMSEMGEQLPVYRPPLDMHNLFGEPELGETGDLSVAVRYVTVHNKWAIHSSYHDNLYMQTLSRGGTHAWMSPQDAAKIGVKDHDWIECENTNGVFVGRAVVSHRMPEGVVYVHHAQDRQARGYPQLGHPHHGQTHPHYRWLCPPGLCLQLPGTHR